MLAAAVRANADLIVTYNRRHFPAASLEPSQIDVQAPSTFLRGPYDVDPGVCVIKLHEQAAAVGLSLRGLLRSLSKNVPQFVEYFCQEQGLDLRDEQQGAPR